MENKKTIDGYTKMRFYSHRFRLLIIFGLIILVSMFGLLYLNQQKDLPSAITTPTPTQMTSEKQNIILRSPAVNEMVSLPIVITGEARVFENQLNYRIRHDNTMVLVEGSAYADSPDSGLYGPFTIEVNSLPNIKMDKLIVEIFDYSAKDGSEVDTIKIPVQFDNTKTVITKVYFGSKHAPAGEECSTLYPVERLIVKTPTPARAALEELLKGLFVLDRESGYFTSINDGVSIQKLTIVDGVARVDFDKKLEEGVGGSCKVAAIRAQITQTLKQFPTVKNVIISIDGRTDDILQP